MPADPSLAPRRLAAGAVAGLTGGLVFGVFLQLEGMMVDVMAALVGSESLLMGWLLHLALSALFGVVFAAVMDERSLWLAWRAGVVYGVVLWLVTGTLVLRLSLGIPFAVDTALGNLLIGHVLYGAVMGPVYAWRWRSAAARGAPDRTRAPA